MKRESEKGGKERKKRWERERQGRRVRGVEEGKVGKGKGMKE